MASQYLGCLTNNKPSAIFKISKRKAGEQNENALSTLFAAAVQQRSLSVVQVGLSIESLQQLSAQQSSIEQAATAQLSTFEQFATWMCTNLLNFASSFELRTAEQLGNALANRTLVSNEPLVPLSILQKWYETCMRRFRVNPNFWKSMPN